MPQVAGLAWLPVQCQMRIQSINHRLHFRHSIPFILQYEYNALAIYPKSPHPHCHCPNTYLSWVLGRLIYREKDPSTPLTQKSNLEAHKFRKTNFLFSRVIACPLTEEVEDAGWMVVLWVKCRTWSKLLNDRH